MRVSVNDLKCQGHARCGVAVPEVFALGDDDGHARVLDPEVPAELEGRVRAAASACPERAIEVVD